MRFFGPNPALMVVEPESLCWITGRIAATRDGATWAREFARLPALKAVVREGVRARVPVGAVRSLKRLLGRR